MDSNREKKRFNEKLCSLNILVLVSLLIAVSTRTVLSSKQQGSRSCLQGSTKIPRVSCHYRNSIIWIINALSLYNWTVNKELNVIIRIIKWFKLLFVAVVTDHPSVDSERDFISMLILRRYSCQQKERKYSTKNNGIESVHILFFRQVETRIHSASKRYNSPIISLNFI